MGCVVLERMTVRDVLRTAFDNLLRPEERINSDYAADEGADVDAPKKLQIV